MMKKQSTIVPIMPTVSQQPYWFYRGNSTEPDICFKHIDLAMLFCRTYRTAYPNISFKVTYKTVRLVINQDDI